MGGVFSKRKSSAKKSWPPADEGRKRAFKIGDSGELRPAPAKTGAGKVPEMSSILGRAGIASIEKAVDVFDTLGSSMSNLNPSSGFVSGMTTRGNKISILTFEVANTIARGANLLRSLSDENIQFVKEEILHSYGVRQLVSTDIRELMSIAAFDKREELDIFSGEVIRFGNLCKDPVWHNLGRYFDKFSMVLTPQEQLKEEAETTMQQLLKLAENASGLYHELHALGRFEQDYQRKLQEEESLPSARRESLMILYSELKRQRKLVKSLKKKSLWSRNLEEVVEKLVDIVAFLDQRILEAFDITAASLVDHEPVHERTLGACGLSLHYANIINRIDSIVARPLSLPPNTRDTLYHGLPEGVKAVLRSRLQSYDLKEQYTVAQIKAEMEKTLRWLVPIAENTLKAHQGFGWVGEWANISTEVNKKPVTEHNINRIQTLHHANKEKTEEYILELVVWLHHLVIQAKNRGAGFRASKPSKSDPQLVSPAEVRQGLSQVRGGSRIVAEVTQEERELLEFVSSHRVVFQRSKSQKDFSWKNKIRQRSRSCGSSPTKFDLDLDMHLERTQALDIMDGLDTLDLFPIVPILD